eukprot:GHVT01101993.1.p1 GENE.GHVT01101993.1~~GHVT01101993.1.p1  ORF type:complete len:1132 (-),score=171.99 GHVT01101993.1:3130-6525(-)
MAGSRQVGRVVNYYRLPQASSPLSHSLSRGPPIFRDVACFSGPPMRGRRLQQPRLRPPRPYDKFSNFSRLQPRRLVRSVSRFQTDEGHPWHWPKATSALLPPREANGRLGKATEPHKHAAPKRSHTPWPTSFAVRDPGALNADADTGAPTALASLATIVVAVTTAVAAGAASAAGSVRAVVGRERKCKTLKYEGWCRVPMIGNVVLPPPGSWAFDVPTGSLVRSRSCFSRRMSTSVAGCRRDHFEAAGPPSSASLPISTSSAPPAPAAPSLPSTQPNFFSPSHLKSPVSTMAPSTVDDLCLGGVHPSLLGVHPALVNAMETQGICRLTRQQAVAVKHVDSGKDTVVHLPTGSGKTLSYLLPFINRLYQAHDIMETIILDSIAEDTRAVSSAKQVLPPLAAMGRGDKLNSLHLPSAGALPTSPSLAQAPPPVSASVSGALGRGRTTYRSQLNHPASSPAALLAGYTRRQTNALLPDQELDHVDSRGWPKQLDTAGKLVAAVRRSWGGPAVSSASLQRMLLASPLQAVRPCVIVLPNQDLLAQVVSMARRLDPLERVSIQTLTQEPVANTLDMLMPHEHSLKAHSLQTDEAEPTQDHLPLHQQIRLDWNRRQMDAAVERSVKQQRIVQSAVSATSQSPSSTVGSRPMRQIASPSLRWGGVDLVVCTVSAFAGEVYRCRHERQLLPSVLVLDEVDALLQGGDTKNEVMDILAAIRPRPPIAQRTRASTDKSGSSIRPCQLVFVCSTLPCLGPWSAGSMLTERFPHATVAGECPVGGLGGAVERGAGGSAGGGATSHSIIPEVSVDWLRLDEKEIEKSMRRAIPTSVDEEIIRRHYRSIAAQKQLGSTATPERRLDSTSVHPKSKAEDNLEKAAAVNTEREEPEEKDEDEDESVDYSNGFGVDDLGRLHAEERRRRAQLTSFSSVEESEALDRLYFSSSPLQALGKHTLVITWLSFPPASFIRQFGVALVLMSLGFRGGRVVVFVNDTNGCARLRDELAAGDWRVAAYHRGINISRRMHALRQLREGTVNVLIATDLLARGVDTPFVDQVVNFQFPSDAVTYLHRAGKAGQSNQLLNFYFTTSDICTRELFHHKIRTRTPPPRCQRNEPPRAIFTQTQNLRPKKKKKKKWDVGAK